MSNTRMARRACGAFPGPAMVWLALAGCAPNLVPIPSPGADHPPVISISATPSGAGHVTTSPVSSDASVGVTAGATIVIMASAKNPGGVESLSVTVTQAGRQLYNVLRTASPNSDNKVPDLLTIVGTNGLSGDALLATMTDQVVVAAQATNFNGQGSSINVRFDPITAPSPQPETMGIYLQGQSGGLTGDLQPFAYTFGGNLTLQQIELPVSTANFWVAGIKLPKLGISTTNCNDPTKVVLLPTGSHTTPEQMQEIYGSQAPSMSPGGQIVACVSAKPGAGTISQVSVIITYTR